MCGYGDEHVAELDGQEMRPQVTPNLGPHLLP